MMPSAFPSASESQLTSSSSDSGALTGLHTGNIGGQTVAYIRTFVTDGITLGHALNKVSLQL
jgi:hypothetical protein